MFPDWLPAIIGASVIAAAFYGGVHGWQHADMADFRDQLGSGMQGAAEAVAAMVAFWLILVLAYMIAFSGTSIVRMCLL